MLLLKLYFLWDLFFVIVAFEVDCLEEESLGRSNRQIKLVFEKSIANELSRVPIDKHKHNSTNHFANLIVHKTLALNGEFNKVFVRAEDLASERNNVTFGLRIFGLEVSGVVVEVVGSNKL